MGRILDSVLGHEGQISSLLQVIEAGRLPSTLLFCGLEGVGKKKVALAMAQILVCEKREGCGECPPCVRLDNGQSESLLLISQEKRGSLIKAEESRQVLKFLRLKMDGGCSRVIVIDGADRLNPHAANILLKTLEEPPERTYFILIASGLGAVLPTIRSRSQVIRFSPLSNGILKKYVHSKGGGPEDGVIADWIIDASGGSLGKLERMGDGSWGEVRQAAMNFMSGALNGNMDYFHSLKGLVRDREEALFMSRWLQTVLRDGLWAKTHSEGWLNGDCQGMVDYLAQMRARSLLEMADGAKGVEIGIQANFDRTLLFEDLWYKYRDVMNLS